MPHHLAVVAVSFSDRPGVTSQDGRANRGGNAWSEEMGYSSIRFQAGHERRRSKREALLDRQSSISGRTDEQHQHDAAYGCPSVPLALPGLRQWRPAAQTVAVGYICSSGDHKSRVVIGDERG